MKERFTIKYCNIIDAVLVLDTLKRMPKSMIIHNHLYVHGLICNDRVEAEYWQEYFEELFGFQRSLVQKVTGFDMRSYRGEYGTVYEVFDNIGKLNFRFTENSKDAMEFWEWLDMEMNQ